MGRRVALDNISLAKGSPWPHGNWLVRQLHAVPDWPMNIGTVIPGFSDGEQDWCIPVYLNLVKTLALTDNVRVFAMRYPSRRDRYHVFNAQVIALGGHSSTAGIGRLALMARTVATIVREQRARPFDVLHAIWADETGVAACI